MSNANEPAPIPPSVYHESPALRPPAAGHVSRHLPLRGLPTRVPAASQPQGSMHMVNSLPHCGRLANHGKSHGHPAHTVVSAGVDPPYVQYFDTAVVDSAPGRQPWLVYPVDDTVVPANVAGFPVHAPVGNGYSS